MLCLFTLTERLNHYEQNQYYKNTDTVNYGKFTIKGGGGMRVWSHFSLYKILLLNILILLLSFVIFLYDNYVERIGHQSKSTDYN